MCSTCGVTMRLVGAEEYREAVERARVALADMPVSYRRPLTAIELAYGDVPRVRQDFDDAAVTIVEIAGPVVRKIATQLVVEAVALAKAKDMAGISRVTPSFVGELATALKKGISAALATGRRQVTDQHARQTGAKLEIKMPPKRKQLKRVSEYLSARADIDSERISFAIAANVRAATISQIARDSSIQWMKDALDYANPDSILARAILGGENSLIGTATADAREGVGLGRLFAVDEVKDQIESVTYTAILDENVCDVCAELDGEEYGGDEAGKTPNDDCIGEQYGNSCRCFEVYVFTKD